MLETSTRAFARIRQRISTLFKTNLNKIPSLYEATKHWLPIWIGEVKAFSKHGFLIPQSDQWKLVRSREEKDHVRKRLK